MLLFTLIYMFEQKWHDRFCWSFSDISSFLIGPRKVSIIFNPLLGYNKQTWNKNTKSTNTNLGIAAAILNVLLVTTWSSICVCYLIIPCKK